MLYFRNNLLELTEKRLFNYLVAGNAYFKTFFCMILHVLQIFRRVFAFIHCYCLDHNLQEVGIVLYGCECMYYKPSMGQVCYNSHFSGYDIYLRGIVGGNLQSGDGMHPPNSSLR
jgi:hypothetical protein